MRTILLAVITFLQFGILNAQQPAQSQPPTQPQAQPQPMPQMQPGQPPMRFTKEMRAKMETDRMKTQLALTDSQAVKVQKIALKYAEMTEDLQKKMMELRTKQNEEVKQLLTPEQLEKLSKLNEAHRQPPPPPVGTNTNSPAPAPQKQ